MFRASSCPSSGAYQLQQQPLVLPSERGGSSAVGRGRAGYNRLINKGIRTERIVIEMTIRSVLCVGRIALVS